MPYTIHTDVIQSINSSQFLTLNVVIAIVLPYNAALVLDFIKQTMTLRMLSWCVITNRLQEQYHAVLSQNHWKMSHNSWFNVPFNKYYHHRHVVLLSRYKHLYAWNTLMQYNCCFMTCLNYLNKTSSHMPKNICNIDIIRSTLPSRPNYIRGGLKCLSVSMSIHPQKVFFPISVKFGM